MSNIKILNKKLNIQLNIKKTLYNLLHLPASNMWASDPEATFLS